MSRYIAGVDIGGYFTAPCKVEREGDTYRITLTGESRGVDMAALKAALTPKFAALTLTDATRLPADLWARRGEDNLTGQFLEKMWQLCSLQPDNDTLQLAARFGLAALEGGEDPAL